MTPHRSWFHDYAPYIVPVRLANGVFIKSAGVGTIVFRPKDGTKVHMVKFSRVLHVPQLESNLLSILYLTQKKDFVVTIVKDKMSFSKNSVELFTATVNSNNSAHLDGVTIPKSEFAGRISTCPLDLTLWHRRFSHLNHGDIKKLYSKTLVTGMSIDSEEKPDPICEPCLAGKQHRDINKVATNRASQPLELIHTDLHGPMPVRTPEGYRYWVTFIDDATRFMSVAALKRKSEAFIAFKQFKTAMENQTGYKVKIQRDDKGGEYISKAYDEYCRSQGILRQHTITNEPHQNGVAERANRTLDEGVTTMLEESKLPLSMWYHALAALVHTRNRSPNSALGGNISFTCFYGKVPDVSYFRVFGCTAYVHVQKNKRKKLQSHTQRCVFIGYPLEYKGWKFYNPITKTILFNNSVVFDERYFPGLSKAKLPEAPPDHPVSRSESTLIEVPANSGGVSIDLEPEEQPVIAPDQDVSASPSVHSDVLSPAMSPDPLLLVSPEPSPSPEPQRRYPDRARSQPDRFEIRHERPHVVYREPTPMIESSDEEDQGEPLLPINEGSDDELCRDYSEDALSCTLLDGFELAYKVVANEKFPRTFKEALNRPDSQKWFDAAKQEVDSLIKNGTWKLVKLPTGRKAIGCRWVFIIKYDKEGFIERYKARLVAKGYSQRPGFDFNETFAPTAKWATLRTVLCLAALGDLELESVDISSAFLNGELEEEVYMEQPPGFPQGEPGLVLQLLKGLYGLKQSPRIWHRKLDSVLQELGFKKVTCDNSIWLYEKDQVKIILPVFVDDMTIASNSKAAIQNFKDELKGRFEIHDLGPTKFLLGVGIECDRAKRLIHLSQTQYIKDLLEAHEMQDCNYVSTPMNPGLKLEPDQNLLSEKEAEQYRSAVGSLLYLAIATRPDISYTVGVLARFNASPGISHWAAVKHLFRYLKGTMDYCLTYSSTTTSELFLTYSDSDHAGDSTSGKSTGAYVVKMGGGAISWQSKLQSIVTLSTTEAEYVAAVSAGQEILWLRNLFTELGFDLKDLASTLFVDNQSAIAVGRNPEHHGRIKHLDLRYYWLRDEVNSGKIAIEYCPTQDMPADMLTKALPKAKVNEFLPALGIIAPEKTSKGMSH